MASHKICEHYVINETENGQFHNEPDVLSNQNKIWDPAETVEFYSTISAGSRHSNFIKRHLVIVPGQVGVSSRRR